MKRFRLKILYMGILFYELLYSLEAFGLADYAITIAQKSLPSQIAGSLWSPFSANSYQVTENCF